MKRLLLLLLIFLAACEQATPTPDPLDVPINKVLATAYISPTPDDAQRRATLIAAVPQVTSVPPTLIPSPTAYIGVFLGEVQEIDMNLIATPNIAEVQVNTAADPTRCQIALENAFVFAWSQNDTISEALGCPIQRWFGFRGEVQVFERGVIYQREETGELWAIVPSGTGVGQFWYVERAPTVGAGNFTAPAGLRVPTGDFAGIWAGVPGVREALGFALTPAQKSDLGLQRFEGGTFFYDQTVQQVFALIVDGSAYGPY